MSLIKAALNRLFQVGFAVVNRQNDADLDVFIVGSPVRRSGQRVGRIVGGLVRGDDPPLTFAEPPLEFFIALEPSQVDDVRIETLNIP